MLEGFKVFNLVIEGGCIIVGNVSQFFDGVSVIVIMDEYLVVKGNV